MKLRWIVALSVTVLLAACGQRNAANPTTTPDPAEVIGDVTLTRSGGLAGITSTVTVRGDGSVLVTDDSQGFPATVLSESDLNELHALIGGPDFAALSKNYVPPDGVCCDFFFYTVTAQIGERTIESSTADTVESPAVLQQTIALLLGLMP